MNITLPGGEVRIPQGITTHAAFLTWFRSDDGPGDVRVDWIMNDVWVEIMAERAFAHNKIKSAVTHVVYGLVKAEKLGHFFSDGMVYTNDDEQFTTAPDGMFVSREAMENRRVWLTGGEGSAGDTELLGVPDLVIEVVSPSSVDKDTVWLMAKYWAAGVPEYWLIDAREGPLTFTIYRRGPDEYRAVRRVGGWVKSAVLGRSFRFAPGERLMGHPTYEFEAR